MDLDSIAQRLDSNEKLKVRYRVQTRTEDGCTAWHERVDKLLDVDADQRKLYVSYQDDSVIWVSQDEALEIQPDDGIYK